ncbi:EpsG family protein [Klebsiella aerogenes]|uniref:EpsG family protein n=1 Tax=Klebsiella aerogenes TaxID=548 RepID=UPI003793998A
MIFLTSFFAMMLVSFVRHRYAVYLSFLMAVLFFCTTYGYGFDWINYYNDYLYATRWEDAPYEIGYYYLMHFFSYVGISFSLYMFLIHFFMFYALLKFSQTTKCPELTFFVLFSAFGFYLYSEQLRQGIAISIILYGMSKNKIESKAVLVYVLISSFFHFSALFFLVSRLVYSSATKYLKASVFFATLSVVFLIYSFNNAALFQSIPYVGVKLMAYNQGYDAENAGIIAYLLQSKIALFYCGFFVILFYFYKQSKDVMIIKSLMSMYFLILTKLSFFLLRFGYYFFPSLALGMDEYIYRKSKPGVFSINKFLYIMFVFLMATIPMWKDNYRNAASEFVTIFDSHEDISRVINSKCLIVRNTGFGDGIIKECTY